MKLETKKLRRLVGLVMAKKARKNRRLYLKTGYGNERYRYAMSRDEIKRGVIKTITGESYGKDWWEWEQYLSDAKLRSALKFWEKAGKVNTQRHGRHGNSYRWVLLAETKYYKRCERKVEERRKQREAAKLIREAKLEATKAWEAKETEKTQQYADKLSECFGCGSFKARSTTITITREQAKQMYAVMCSFAPLIKDVE